jgi:pimeloyl-ACP methyl ester carboxylesterase
MPSQIPTYVLIPGAGSDPWYWEMVAAHLRDRGCAVVTPELPVEDDTAGLAQYVAVIEEAIKQERNLILVAQSMGALSASVVAGRRKVDRLVLVAPMIPRAGETGGDWWANTGQQEAARELARSEGRDPDAFDPMEIFLHDVPPDVAEESAHHVKDQSGRPFADPWPLESWPDVETRVVAGRYDRLFPLEFMRRVTRERLGIEPDVIDCGHLPALARPAELVDLLESYR